MALSLARSGALKPERGDLVLFANTSAEHPATYRFAARICDELEQEHAVPCLWHEYRTIEIAAKNGWKRAATFQLVRRVLASDEDEAHAPGYRAGGEVFERAISMLGTLPNTRQRLCTQHLKILPSQNIIAEWLGSAKGLTAVGHQYDSQVTLDDCWQRYRGKLERADFERMKSAALLDSPHRPAQDWSDFTRVDEHRALVDHHRADIWGKQGRPVRFVSLLGLRADEQKRVDRVLDRAIFAEGATGRKCRDDSQPAGEMVYTPLHDHDATREDVAAFWSGEPYDLEIDSSLGNCAFCFLKGVKQLTTIMRMPDPERKSGTPTDPRWWSDIEQKYGRASTKHPDRRFGFTNFDRPSYAELIERVEDQPALELASSISGELPCDCTD